MAIVLPNAFGDTEPPIRLPLIWPVMPFTMWASLACGVTGLLSLVRNLAPPREQGTGPLPRYLLTLLWFVGAILFFSIFKASGDSVHLARGFVPLSFPSAVAL